MRIRQFLFSVALVVFGAVALTTVIQIVERPAMAGTNSGGSLQVIHGGKPTGFCPLRHTDVQAEISGFLARVSLTQEFDNTSNDAIEAVYTFPLPQDAAVDDMTIQAGSRTIRGMIKPREEAAAIYAKAIQQGQMAALLDQERPNIFTQTVGNIPPGVAVRVQISYVVRLKYEDGGYEFVFPMVVGPRYIPGELATGKQGGGWAPDTNRVPDASKITPPVVSPERRAGHDVSLEITMDAGVPIQGLRSPSHDIDVERTGPGSAHVRLRDVAEIPNKDFILRYDVAGAAVAEGLLTHAVPPAGGASTQTDGYFSLIIQPPERFPESDVTPKELVFVLDSSGSMDGFPVEKAKRFMEFALDNLYASDTFNVIKFSGDTAILFDEPVYPSAENVRRAREFVSEQWGGGGTEMMKAIRAALAPSDSADHMRIVVFLTDGFVGNDMEIVAEVQKHPNARVFAYGVGSSVNRFLLDKMSEAGRGAVEYVGYKPDDKEAEAAAQRLYQRLRAPLLTDISLDLGSLPVSDVYPRTIPDLFSARPVVVSGRYTGAADGVIRLTGKRAGDAYVREIPVSFSVSRPQNAVLRSMWARDKVDDLMSQDWAGLQGGSMKPELKKQITDIGLQYRLMTQFTSFVAVEERVVTEGGEPKHVQVPVELPAGMQYEEQWSGADKKAVPGAVAGSVIVGRSVHSLAILPSRGRSISSSPSVAVQTTLASPAAIPKSVPNASASNGGIGSGTISNSTPKPPKPVRAVESKLHPRLLAVYDCWHKQADKAKAPSICNKGGEKVLVQVLLKSASADVEAGLKKAGFEPLTTLPGRNRLVGWIRIEDLGTLVENNAVQFVVPGPDATRQAGK